MPTHAEERVLPYTPEQLFALVADVERYPEFLPWCVGARIKKRQPDLIVADLIIGFRMFRERFTSRVSLDRPERIDPRHGRAHDSRALGRRHVVRLEHESREAELDEPVR